MYRVLRDVHQPEQEETPAAAPTALVPPVSYPASGIKPVPKTMKPIIEKPEQPAPVSHQIREEINIMPIVPNMPQITPDPEVLSEFTEESQPVFAPVHRAETLSSYPNDYPNDNPPGDRIHYGDDGAFSENTRDNQRPEANHREHAMDEYPPQTYAQPGGWQTPVDTHPGPHHPSGGWQIPADPPSGPHHPSGGWQIPADPPSGPHHPSGGWQIPADPPSGPYHPPGGWQTPAGTPSEPHHLPGGWQIPADPPSGQHHPSGGWPPVETDGPRPLHWDDQPLPSSSAAFIDDAEILASSSCVVSPPYPGTPLRLGSTGSNVAMIQRYLNALRIYLSPMPPLLNVDGRYGTTTRNAVIIFQGAVGLNTDGTVGRQTWDAIVLRYNCIFGEPLVTPSVRTPALPLRPGSRGSDVLLLQGLLNMLSTIYSAITPIAEDSIYGAQTTEAVRTFQHENCLTIDGIVGPVTWNMIIAVSQTQQTRSIGCIYTGSLIRIGSTGESVRLVQSVLDRIRAVFNHPWDHLKIDGNFGSKTHNAVMQFQIAYQIAVHDGIVGPITSNKLIQVFNETLRFGLPD